ncbi:YgaP family membrane protein [Cohnella panacarvi]|uniref:YgaP family membrane protein n=1 Tax=Cohnella panacarvi TaxID=400776 RepID=UPI000A0465C0|nr:DUF2892 domain-containing protein [Cohnella panacarvi]
MNCNVGKTEQIIRISVGVSILLLGLRNKSWWGLAGLAPILTGTTRYCPLNTALRIDNC